MALLSPRRGAYRLGAASPGQQTFDSVLRFKPGSNKRVACSETVQHCLDIGSVRILPPDTTDGHWSTFLTVSKKDTDKMRGCVDLRWTNKCIKYEHFEVKGLHTVARMLRCNDYMTKINICDFYHQYLLRQLDHRWL